MTPHHETLINVATNGRAEDHAHREPVTARPCGHPSRRSLVCSAATTAPGESACRHGWRPPHVQTATCASIIPSIFLDRRAKQSKKKVSCTSDVTGLLACYVRVRAQPSGRWNGQWNGQWNGHLDLCHPRGRAGRVAGSTAPAYCTWWWWWWCKYKEPAPRVARSRSRGTRCPTRTQTRPVPASIISQQPGKHEWPWALASNPRGQVRHGMYARPRPSWYRPASRRRAPFVACQVLIAIAGNQWLPAPAVPRPKRELLQRAPAPRTVCNYGPLGARPTRAN